ncbi:MAG: pitrilysin family protein [Bacteroidota bacterium]
MLDRTKAPSYQTIQSVFIPKAQTQHLDNGLPLHVINVGEQPLIRLECIFKAGTWYESARATSLFTTKMLNEGTSTYSSRQISEYVDQYGAFIEFNHGVDKITITVYTLVRYLPEILILVSDILQDSIFPAKELENVKNITAQTLKVNLEKNTYIANMAFRSLLFGKNHPYGKSLQEEDIDSVEANTLNDFYQHYMRGRAFDIVLAGKVTEKEVALVNRYLGKLPVTMAEALQVQEQVYIPELVPAIIEKTNSLQSTIRLGRRLFPRQNPNYLPISLLNEILGGYFGSRLMKNIREDKGFTYGISSNTVTFIQEGYWIIGTDVKRESTRQTLQEIDNEINILKTELVEEEELETVKNYMIGSFAGSLNTAFDIADRFKITHFEGLPLDYYDHYIDNLQAVSAPQILTLANQYLDKKLFQEVVVGGIN